MSSLDKYVDIFVKTFNVTPDEAKILKYRDVETWDSVGHMGLISEIESTFDIMMDADDIIDFSSFEKGIEILKKYNVEF